jgi:hypothetical protein
MIGAEHFEYQTPTDADHLWLESMLFEITDPVEDIYALVYVNIRPGLGVMWNQVMVCGTLTESRSDLLHYNENHFLPAPARFSDIDSPFGLKIRGVDLPRNFAIDYEHEDGTAIHVSWNGIMPPFDTHDPNCSPQAGRAADMHADKGLQHHGQSGHFDMSGRVHGTVTVRGRTFHVNSISRMDHSWGPRDPMKVPNMFIVSAAFEPDIAFHMICPWNPDKTGAQAFELAHGYVTEGGEVFGLTSDAVITAQHHGLMCTGLQMSVSDIRGTKHELTATPGIGAPWIAGPNAMTHNALMKWTYQGRTGYGVVMKNYSLQYLNQKRGRFSDGQTSAIYV